MKIFWFVFKFFASSVLFALFALAIMLGAEKIYESDSFFLEASGAETNLEKLVYFKRFLHYKARSYIFSFQNDDFLFPKEERHGHLEGATRDGEVVYTFYRNGDTYEFKSELINTIILNKKRLNDKIEDIDYNRARIEVYANGETLVWLQDQPFNLLLINAGIAKPHPRPPTNMVDKFYADYYWSLLN